MNSNLKTITTLCAGGITVGAVISVSAVLLLGNSSLSQLSDEEAFKKGLEFIVTDTSTTSNSFDALSNLTNQAYKSDLTFNINKLYQTPNLDNSTLSVSLRSDVDNKKFDTNFSFKGANQEAFTFSGYLDDDLLAVTTSAMDDVIVAKLSDLIDSYNTETSYLYGSMGLTENWLTSYSDILSGFDTSLLKDGMKNIYDEGMEKLYSHIEYTRDDSSSQINGYDTHCLSAQIKTTDVLDIIYDELQYVLTNEDVTSYLCKQESLLSSLDMTSEDLAKELSKLSLGMTMYYSQVSEAAVKVLGDTINVDMYLTNDVEVRKLNIKLPMNGAALGSTQNICFDLTLNYMGEDNIKDYKSFEFAITEGKENVRFILETGKKDNTSNLSFAMHQNDDEAFKITFENNLADNKIKSKLMLFTNAIEIATVNVEGTYELSNNSLSFDISKFSVTASAIKLFDATINGGIYPLDNEIKIPSGHAINYKSLDEEQLADMLSNMFNLTKATK